MDKTPRQRRSSENEANPVKTQLAKNQQTSQTTSSPKKQINSSSQHITKSTQMNSSPRKQQNAVITHGPKSPKRSPRKIFQRYRPVAEDKIQTDIVNAIVARDADATMKRKVAQISIRFSRQSINHSKIHGNHVQLSPKKMLSKGTTRGQPSPTTKKDFANGAISPRKPRKAVRKPPIVMSLPKEKLQSSAIKPSSITETLKEKPSSITETLKEKPSSITETLKEKPSSITETLKETVESKVDDPKLPDDKQDSPVNVKSIIYLECPKSKMIEGESVSSDLNVNNVKDKKSRKAIKPPGPLVKRSPFKNNPRFNKKQCGNVIEQRVAEENKIKV